MLNQWQSQWYRPIRLLCIHGKSHTEEERDSRDGCTLSRSLTVGVLPVSRKNAAFSTNQAKATARTQPPLPTLLCEGLTSISKRVFVWQSVCNHTTHCQLFRSKGHLFDLLCLNTWATADQLCKAT